MPWSSPAAAAAARSSRARRGGGSGPDRASALQATYPHLPAIPQDPGGVPDTLAKLQVRAQQVTQAKQGMTRKFRIGGTTATGYAFLFGGRAPISLERPEQYAMSWTTYPDVYSSGAPHLPDWTESLSDADTATRQFWPMIARHGIAFNLIVPERVTAARARELRHRFQIPWTQALRRANAAGNLYAIDMSRFEALQPQTVGGDVRFTPATVTLLTRDPRTKTLTPVAIVVAGYRGRGRSVFTRDNATEGAWLYALQAAKTSIAVFGIWLGHVYHWHIVTAAMQMTMLNTLPASHPVYQLLAPQSKYLIPFDDVLLALWPRIAPPTSVATADQFLSLANHYADGRSFFEDDPQHHAEEPRSAPIRFHPCHGRGISIRWSGSCWRCGISSPPTSGHACAPPTGPTRPWPATVSYRPGSRPRRRRPSATSAGCPGWPAAPRWSGS